MHSELNEVRYDQLHGSSKAKQYSTWSVAEYEWIPY